MQKKSNLIVFSEEIKLNCIFFQRNLFEFLARLGVGQGLINMFSDVLQKIYLISRATRTKMNE